MAQNGFAIAIDGPVASGKGTVSNLLAELLHGFHFNTGAMYRGLTFYCLDNGINLQNDKEVVKALGSINFELKDDKIFINGKDITSEITQSKVTAGAPVVAAISEVRAEMVKRQREIGLKKIAEGKIVLVDARDAATKIFPDAKLKIFLTATAEVRAKRRLDQLGHGNFEEVLASIKERDHMDTYRKATPLVSDPKRHGYWVIDNSNLTKHDTIDIILRKIREYDSH